MKAFLDPFFSVLVPASLVALLAACGSDVVTPTGSSSASAGGGGATSGTNGTGGATASAGGAGGVSTGGGQGGEAGTIDVSVGVGGSGGGQDCDGLFAAFKAALEAATACNSCLDFDGCIDGPVLSDECGCAVGGNSANPDEVAKATETFDAWTKAGCGPFLCFACPPAAEWGCVATGQGCDGTCMSLTF